MYNKYFTMKRSELKEAIKAEITSVLSENESKSAVHSLGKDLYDHMTNTFKMKGSLSSPIKADTINKGQQFTVLINDNGGKFGIVSLRIPVGKDNINKEYIQKNIVDQVKRKYKELETRITQIDSTGNNKAMVDFTLTGPNLFQKVTEEIQVGDIVTLGGDGDELEVIDSRRMFGSDMMAYRVKFPDGNTEEYSADQLRPARMMNEGKRGVVVDPDEIMMHINQYQSGNIDGDDLAQAIEKILVAMMNKSVTFSDIREEKETLDSVLKKIKDELEIYKTSKDTDKKKAAVEKLKDLNKKKKDLLSKEEEKVANIGRNQELDA